MFGGTSLGCGGSTVLAEQLPKQMLTRQLAGAFVRRVSKANRIPAFVRTMADFKNLSEEEWKATLTPVQFQILRLKGTERAGTGKYNKTYDEGVYVCAGCKTPLYTSTTKFDSGCGWPAFYDAIPGAIKVGRTRTRQPRLISRVRGCSRCSVGFFCACRLCRTPMDAARRSCAPSATGMSCSWC